MRQVEAGAWEYGLMVRYAGLREDRTIATSVQCVMLWVGCFARLLLP
jgi:hypothetical protein